MLLLLPVFCDPGVKCPAEEAAAGVEEGEAAQERQAGRPGRAGAAAPLPQQPRHHQQHHQYQLKHSPGIVVFLTEKDFGIKFYCAQIWDAKLTVRSSRHL